VHAGLYHLELETDTYGQFRGSQRQHAVLLSLYAADGRLVYQLTFATAHSDGTVFWHNLYGIGRLWALARKGKYNFDHI
jgi:hypothetical protein